MEELYQRGQEQVASQEVQPVPEKEVRSARELLQSLVKTKRAFEMYPANNPILARFQEDLNKRFSGFLDEFERLVFVIRQFDILYKGQAVYQNQEKDDNLALFFYKDGLRELTFSAGLTGDEIIDFIDVIRARPESSVESFDDDIVTLLWEKDFVHLSYYVVEEFTEGSALADEEVQRLLEQHKTTDGELSAAYTDAMAEEEEVFSPLERISMGFQGIFSLGEEEVKYLKEEMEALSDEAFLEGAIHVLFESLYIDRGTADFGILMDNLDSALGYLVFTGGFSTAGLILRRFRDLLKQADAFGPQEMERIRKSIARAGGDGSIKSVADVLNSGADIDTEAFKFYLNQLDRNALIPLSNLLGEIQEIKYRKALMDAIVVLGRDNIDILAAGLKDKRWFVVRNVAAILGRIGDKAALEHLKQALSHPEPKVRREIVRSLGMVGGPKAGEMLLIAMEDPDPQIRMAALRYLPAAHSFAVLDSLLETITAKDFGDRALTEKRVFFEVLAEIGQERVLPFLLKTLRKRSLFGGAKHEELRVSAAYGLGNVHQNEALSELEDELKRNKKGSVLSEAISYSIHKLKGLSGREERL